MHKHTPLPLHSPAMLRLSISEQEHCHNITIIPTIPHIPCPDPPTCHVTSLLLPGDSSTWCAISMACVHLDASSATAPVPATASRADRRNCAGGRTFPEDASAAEDVGSACSLENSREGTDVSLAGCNSHVLPQDLVLKQIATPADGNTWVPELSHDSLWPRRHS